MLKDPNSLQEPVDIKSEFIESLGPIKTIGTIGWLLQKEISQRNFKIAFIEGVQQKINMLQGKKEAIIDSSKKTEIQINGITFLLNENLKKIDLFIKTYSPFVKIFTDEIEKYFEVVMLMVCFGLVGYLCVAWPKIKCCAILLHISWYCSICVLIVGIVLCAGMLAVGLILNNGICKASEGMLSDSNFLAKEGIQISEQLREGLNYCLFNGDVDFFGVRKPLGEIQLLERDIQAFQQLELSKQSLNSKIQYAQNVLINEKLAAIDLAQNATQGINNWSDYSLDTSFQASLGSCTVTRDQWIWVDGDCTYSTIIDSKQSDFDLGFTVCLRIGKSQDSFVNQRYSHKSFDTCKTSVGKEIITRFQAIERYQNNQFLNFIVIYEKIIRYRISVRDVFSGVLNDLNEYNADVDKLDIDIDKVSVKLKQLSSEFNGMFKVSTLQNGGLQQTLNCTFVRDSLVRAKNAICISGMNGILLYTMFFMATSVLLIFFSLIICLSAARVLPNKDEEIQKQMILSTIQQNQSILQQSQQRDVTNNLNDSDYEQYYSKRGDFHNKPSLSEKNHPQTQLKPQKRGNNQIFSDQEQLQHHLNQMEYLPSKGKDNSFQVLNPQDMIEMQNKELDSSYHSANNHF